MSQYLPPFFCVQCPLCFCCVQINPTEVLNDFFHSFDHVGALTTWLFLNKSSRNHQGFAQQIHVDYPLLAPLLFELLVALTFWLVFVEGVVFYSAHHLLCFGMI